MSGRKEMFYIRFLFIGTKKIIVKDGKYLLLDTDGEDWLVGMEKIGWLGRRRLVSWDGEDW